MRVNRYLAAGIRSKSAGPGAAPIWHLIIFSNSFLIFMTSRMPAYSSETSGSDAFIISGRLGCFKENGGRGRRHRFLNPCDVSSAHASSQVAIDVSFALGDLTVGRPLTTAFATPDAIGLAGEGRCSCHFCCKPGGLRAVASYDPGTRLLKTLIRKDLTKSACLFQRNKNLNRP